MKRKTIAKLLIITVLTTNLIGNTYAFAEENLYKSDASIASLTNNTDVIEINNEKVKNYLLNECGKSPNDNITVNDALKFDTLSLRGMGITDISWIKYFTNVNYLSLDRNEISDISALSNLTHLKSLNLEYNCINDFSPLKEIEKNLITYKIGYQGIKYIDIENMELDEKVITLEKSQDKTLIATVSPSNATNKNVTWTSSDTKVATVDSNGKVTAVAPGTATITAITEDGNKTASCTITVTEPIVNVTDINLNKTATNIYVGKSETLSATVNPNNAENKSVTWSSSDTSIATVDSNGKVTGVKAGTATITVTTKDGSKKATCKVTVSNVKVTGVKLDKTSSNLNVGSALALKATLSPSNATNKNVTWSSSDTKVATVDSKGNVKGIKAGTATITVTTKDGSKKATCKVTVKNVKVSSIKLNKTSTSVAKGKTTTLTATFNPTNATNKNVTWSSSNTKVATVDSNGKVKAVAKGTATITVTTKDGSKKATCKVTVTNPVKVTSVKMNKSYVNVVKGKTTTLSATINPSNATNKGVTWSSNNTDVATVDKNGKVTGKKKGIAIITVKTADGSKTSTCEVMVSDSSNASWNKDTEKKLISDFSSANTNNTNTSTNSFVCSKEHLTYLNNLAYDWVNGKKSASDTKKQMGAKTYNVSGLNKTLTDINVVKLTISGKDYNKILDKAIDNVTSTHYLFMKVYYNSSTNKTELYLVSGTFKCS